LGIPRNLQLACCLPLGIPGTIKQAKEKDRYKGVDSAIANCTKTLLMK
jgi:hypothetical protein